MLVIAVLRHADYHQPADTPSAWLPWPLTERGVEQSKDAAAMIAGFLEQHSLDCIATIDSSRMLRAWQTASTIADELQRELGQAFSIEEYDALAERGVGAAANLTVARIEAVLADDPRYGSPPRGWKSMSEYRLPFQGAESLDEAGLRVAGHIESTWQRHESQRAALKIIVGHGAAIRHAAKHLGVLPAERVGGVSMFHAEPIFLTRDNGRWEIVAGNWKPRHHADEAGDEFSAG